jgi:hypothetical protein
MCVIKADRKSLLPKFSGAIAMTSEAVNFERIAYHEAGHVAGWRHFDPAIFLERGYVLINAAGGYGQTGLSSGNSWVSNSLMPSQPPLIDHRSIVTAMAGRAAEAIRYPDLNFAELVQLSVASDEPLAHRYIQVFYGSDLSPDEIIDRINGAEAEASQILRSVWTGVKSLAEALIARLKTEPGDEAELTGAEALLAMDTAL